MKFCSGGEKMRNASGHLGENERQWKKSEQEHVRHFLHKTCNQEVSGSFTLQSCKTTAKKCTKKVCCTCKVFFSDVVTAVVVALSSLVTSSSKRSRRRFELKTKTRRKIEKHELLRLTVKLKLKGRIFSDNSNRQLKNPIIDSYTN